MVTKVKEAVDSMHVINLLIIGVVGAVLIISVLAIAILAGFQRTIPNVLENLSVASISGLLGMIGQAVAKNSE